MAAFEEKWSQSDSREKLLKISRKVEEQDSLMGMSPYLLTKVKKPV